MLVLSALIQGGLAQDLQEMYGKASSLAQEGKYSEAAAAYAAAIKDHGEFAWEDYGPTFGGLYYDYGVCLLQLESYQEAAQAFRDCHEKYPPNSKIPYGARKKSAKVDSPNMRWELAIFQLGYALQMMEDYEGALAQYQKFIDLKPDSMVLKQVYAALVLRRAKCLISLGKLEEGRKEVTLIFENAGKFQASGQILFQGMLDLALGWVQEASKGGDRLELTARGNEFLDKYGSYFDLSPYEKYRLGFVDRLRRLGLQAQQAGLNLLALRIFAMAPTTQAVVGDMKARAAQMSGTGRTKLEQTIAALEKGLQAPDPAELETLRVIAAAWEGLGNSRAGYLINRFLVERYPSSAVMPQMLHEASRHAFNLANPRAAQYFGELYMEKHGDAEDGDKLLGNVSAFMLQSLFRTRQYELCVETAGKLREKFQEGDPARDLPDFIYSVSLYSLNRQQEAEEALAQYLKSYPESANRESARFFQASVKTVLQKYEEVAPLADAFLKEFEKSKFRDQMLFYRAVAHYTAKEFDKVMQLVDEILQSHPESTALGRVHNLQGDTFRALAYAPAEGKTEADYWKSAKEAYTKAKEATERLEQPDFHAEALFKLLNTCLDLELWEEAVAVYDAFFPDHAGSPYEAQLSVFALDALQKVGRTEDGLKQLEKVIGALSETADTEMLSKAIGSYQKAAVESRGYEKTHAVLDQMMATGSRGLQAQLLVSKLSMFQEQKRQASKEPELAAKFQTEIDAIFKKLSDYKMDQLSDSVLQAIGRHFEESNPFVAKAYFEALLDREDDLFKAPAEMALGRIEKTQNNPNAVQRFIRVIEFYGKDSKYEALRLIPEAHVSIAEMAVQMEDWSLAEQYLIPYINNKQWDGGNKDRRAKATYLYGYSLEMRSQAIKDAAEKQKVVDEAIQAYNLLFGAYPGYPEWSAKAVERGFNIAYNRDYSTPEETRDKQVQAYTYLRVALFTWQKMESGKYDALDRIRNLRDRVEGELGLSAAEIQQIELSRGLRQP